MRPDDIPRVLEIAGRLNEAPHWSPELYRRVLDPGAIPARIALVAEDQASGLAGFLVAALIPPQAELESIAVAATAQRQGTASRLCANLFEILKKDELIEVMLEVRESNHAARALYASLGFAAAGRRTRYYSDPEEDAILLRYHLG